MSNLAVIQIVPGPMASNLERSLSEDGDHPWAFDRSMSQMRGIQANGTYVAFLKATLPSGANLGRQGSVELSTKVTRIVLGRITQRIRETSTPYFDGYPFEFWFELVDDAEHDAITELADAADATNQRIPDLGLTANHLRELLSNARSAKVGLFYDGLPRLAPYFKGFEEIPRLAGSSPTTSPAGKSAEALQDALPITPLGEAAHQFRVAVAAAGLAFDGLNRDLPTAFFAAIAAKRFAILTGLSGSGKTQLARALGQWFGADTSGLRRYSVVPVRADWTSPEPLLGYEDALRPPAADGRRAWNVPEALEFILRANNDPTHAWLLVLDEMNLAHVERYFADVLSGIESGEAVVPNLVPEGNYWYPRSDGPARLALPPNLVIVGTVNVDETTYQFSPKVLDRAFTFEFRVTTEELAVDQRWPVSLVSAAEEHLQSLLTVMADPDWHVSNTQGNQAELADWLLDVHRSLQPIGLEFGHRSYREALRFAATLGATGVDNIDQAWDWVMMTKVLPRVHGGRRQLEAFLKHWSEFAIGGNDDKPLRPLVARKCGRMLASLQVNQFAAFSE